MSSPTKVPCSKCGAGPYEGCKIGFWDWVNGYSVHPERLLDVLDRLATKLDLIDEGLHPSGATETQSPQDDAPPA